VRNWFTASIKTGLAVQRVGVTPPLTIGIIRSIITANGFAQAGSPSWVYLLLME
jgi:hypothetical protein